MAAFIKLLKNGSLNVELPYNRMIFDAFRFVLPSKKTTIKRGICITTPSLFNAVYTILDHYHEPIVVSRNMAESIPASQSKEWETKWQKWLSMVNQIEEESSMSVTRAYTTLHLLANAPPEVVKAAWRALCKKYHPDKTGDNADKFRAVQAAYQVIMRK